MNYFTMSYTFQHKLGIILLFLFVIIAFYYKDYFLFTKIRHGLMAISFVTQGTSFTETKKTNKIPNEVIIRRFSNPPRILNESFITNALRLREELVSENNSSKLETLKQNLSSILSVVVQDQLKYLQNPENCSGLNLVCGHQINVCGFGCQIHHRIGCLIVSYALGVPLIHDESNWPYISSWGDAFLPLGSRCQARSQTYRLIWNKRFPIIYKENSLTYETAGSIFQKYADQIEYPLQNGIPVNKFLGDLVDLIHPMPFLWWVGQFMKFGLRLTKNQQKRIQNAKNEIDFKSPIVGLHVRRTDKVKYKSSLFHDVEEYLTFAEKYYYNNISLDKTPEAVVKNVFLASDDAAVLKEYLKPNSTSGWNFIGFQTRTTQSNPSLRMDSLFEILVDLFLLSDCDYIVCDYSSNV